MPGVPRRALVKLVSAGGFQLKGSGWYATDFKGSGKPAAKKDSGEPAANRKRRVAAEAKSESKPRRRANPRSETKTETKYRNERRGHDTVVGKQRAPRLRPEHADAVTTMKRYIMAGLLVWVPLGITICVMVWLVTTLDQTLLLIPEHLRPEARFRFPHPRAWRAAELRDPARHRRARRKFLRPAADHDVGGLLGRIPFVKSIYSSVKQVSDTVLSDQGTAFRKALLVEFPRPGCWTIAFLTGSPADAVTDHLRGDFISVYVPTTPNPTGGYFVMVPRDSIRELDMSVDDALKYIISMGVVAPRRRGPPIASSEARAPGAAAGARGKPSKLTAQGSRAGCLDRGRRTVRALRLSTRALTNRLQRPPENDLKRTDYCGRIDRRYVDQTVTLMGWVHRRRDHGGVIFVDLRDREGLVQIVFNPDRVTAFPIAESLRNEFVIRVTGRVRLRPEGGANPNLVSGEIEVLADEVEILNAALTPPFQLDDENLSETVRLQHRVIDLRRPPMQKNLMLRHRAGVAARKYLDAHGFIDIETPVLYKSTPEGAREFLVPSRIHHGLFYALPQSPQLFKQMLMMAGFDRYYQIVKCFRDEDLRADRQPEFTQIDIETSFLDELELRESMEELVRAMFTEAIGVDRFPNPFPVMTFADAMRDYGSDKPDLRIRSS